MFTNQGDGTFGLSDTVNLGFSPWDAEVGDLNNDGNTDIVVAGNGSLAVALGNGDGSFAAPVTYTIPPSDLTRVAIGDLDGDGLADVVVTCESAKNFSVLRTSVAGRWPTR